jgi:hypothetical protein
MKKCGAYLQYKKKSKWDHAMPKDLAAKQQHCIEWMSGPSPMASPYQSDDENDVGINEGEQDAVHGLLGMAGCQLSAKMDDECELGRDQVWAA